MIALLAAREAALADPQLAPVRRALAAVAANRQAVRHHRGEPQVTLAQEVVGVRHTVIVLDFEDETAARTYHVLLQPVQVWHLVLRTYPGGASIALHLPPKRVAGRRGAAFSRHCRRR